jgi:hypothetical protein
MSQVKTWVWAVLLVVVGAVAHRVTHPAGFSPILAIALFGAMVLPPSLALVVPLLSLFLGDLSLGFHDQMAVVYLSMIPMVAIGWILPSLNRQVKTWLSWGLAGLVACTLFFVTTNFAVWYSTDLYPHTQQGLADCYLMAIPFFHNSLLSTWLYLAGFEFVRRIAPALVPAYATNR